MYYASALVNDTETSITTPQSICSDPTPLLHACVEHDKEGA